MKKYLVEDYQLDTVMYTLISEQMLLTEGKFAESLMDLALEYFPTFMEKMSPQDIEKIEEAFVSQQVTASEARKWILGMGIKYKDQLMANLPEYAKAIKRFLANKALISKNGGVTELYTGSNETNFKLNFVSLSEINSAIEPREIVLLKKAMTEEGSAELKYEDDEVAVFRILNSSPLQRQAQEIISGWCTKGETHCTTYTGNSYLWDILYKGGNRHPFKNDETFSSSLQYSGRIQIAVKKELSDDFGTTLRGSYGSPVEIRDDINNEISLKPIFERYNGKVLSTLASGIIEYIQKHKMLFWYEYTQNTDVKRQFPDKFIANIDNENKKNLKKAIEAELGTSGELKETGTVMKYIFVSDDGRQYTVSINASMSKMKVTAKADPKQIFKSVIKKRMRDSIVIYNGIELMDLNRPETFTKYVDIKEMAIKNPFFASMVNKIPPAMFGSVMFNYYKQKYPNSSNVEIFNTFFLPYLNVDELYDEIIAKKSGEVVEKDHKIVVPLFKHELTALLLRPLNDIETLPSLINLEVDIVPIAL